MLICNCGWIGTNLIPCKDGTARCPHCMTVFIGIPATRAIYDIESTEWARFTRYNMRKDNCSWFFAWNHYNCFKKHYDTVRKVMV